jgi:hypothetical protein
MTTSQVMIYVKSGASSVVQRHLTKEITGRRYDENFYYHYPHNHLPYNVDADNRMFAIAEPGICIMGRKADG